MKKIKFIFEYIQSIYSIQQYSIRCNNYTNQNLSTEDTLLLFFKPVNRTNNIANDFDVSRNAYRYFYIPNRCLISLPRNSKRKEIICANNYARRLAKSIGGFCLRLKRKERELSKQTEEYRRYKNTFSIIRSVARYRYIRGL